MNDKTLDTSLRRVIFPSLHSTESGRTDDRSSNRTSLDGGKDHHDDSLSLTEKKMPLPFPQAASTSSNPHSSQGRSHASVLLTDSPEPLRTHRHQTGEPSKPNDPSAPKVGAADKTTPMVLVIPPFKGPPKAESLFERQKPDDQAVGNEDVVACQEQESASSLASQVHPIGRRRALQRPIQSILRNKSSTHFCTCTKKTDSVSSLPKLSSIREDEGAESEYSSEESMPVERIKFDPRVWVCEFERSEEERDMTWFSAKEMERFKKQALIRVYVHSAQQDELIPTGTGRVVRRPVQIPKKALYTNPALALDSDPDEDVIKEAYRKRYVLQKRTSM